jgi:GTP 3',8-cyclase
MQAMSARVIPLQDARPARVALPPVAPLAVSPGMPLADALGRPLRDLRISVTDRCNFRCGYCMPKQVFDKHHEFLPHADLLSFEEITRLARVFVGLGVEKLRITGGEPTLRRHLETLIAMLADLRTPDGRELDLTLTTNGSTLAKKAAVLKAAGLKRLTVSLDGLDDAVFQRMNDVGFPVAEVLDGIRAAQDAGLGPIKVNMVVQRGVNDDQILSMARHFRHSGVVLRFIEYMDVGATNGWRMDQVLPSSEVQRRIAEEFALTPLSHSAPGETAERWAYADGGGEVGFISSVTQAFCGDCNRARLSTEGRLYTCLFAHRGHDLRGLLRGVEPVDDGQLAGAIAGVWTGRGDRYSQLRGQGQATPEGERRVEMHYIGG